MSVPVILWRVAAETIGYKATDLSGAGSAKNPGRWNAPGQLVVYAAQTPAVAFLETVAHIPTAGFPLDRFLVQVEVPVDVWNERIVLTVADLDAIDAAWAAIPAGRASADIGSDWYTAASAPLLVVPSVIVPEESAVVINAAHPKASAMTARTVRRVTYDVVLRPALRSPKTP